MIICLFTSGGEYLHSLCISAVVTNRAEFSSLLFKTNFQISSDIEDTVVNIASRQMGVGGDDSWGAPVHPEYRIPSDQDLGFEFVLSFKNA